MSYHKLLNRQVQKYLPLEISENPEVKKFLGVIDNYFEALQRDKALVERALSISEEEYAEINKKLTHEVEVKRKSIEQLYTTLGLIGVKDENKNPEDLLSITENLNQQITLRKSAEEVYTSLVNNSQSGILLEDEHRRVVLTNQLFCDLFKIPAPPEALIGSDCSQSAQQTKLLFKYPEEFVSDIDKILKDGVLVSGNLILADNRILRREYIPIFIDDVSKGHLWSYTDITEQKLAKEALEQSELQNRLIMNSALDAIIVTDNVGLISFWNPQAEKVFGWKESEVIGKKLSDTIIPSYHKNGNDNRMDLYAQTGQGPILNKLMELPAFNIKGEEFPIELSIIPVKHGDLEFFCSFIRDISDRKKNEAALRDSQELLQFALDGAGAAVWEYDFQTDKVLYSRKFKSMLGYQDDEFKNSPEELRMRVHPNDLELFNQTDKDYSEGKINSHHREYRVQNKSGNYCWILDRGMVVSYTEEGKPKRIIGTQSDITERKLSENTVKLREEKYRSIIANMNLGLLEVDNEDRIQYVNNSFCKMIGYTPEELAGKRASEILMDSDVRYLIEDKNIQRKSGISDAYEVPIITKQGEEKWFLISGAPRYNDNGELVGSIGIHLDITDQKSLERELIKARDVAEASRGAKETFLANMSHEIRTPMSAILGMANQLSKTGLSQNQKFFLDTIRSSADNLLVIINDILDLSKIESGKLSIEQIGFEPEKVMSHLMQVMQHRAEEKGLKFSNSISDSVSDVLIGDPYRLSQIMLNLVSNAIKFTNQGEVHISFNVLEDFESEQKIEVTVRDTGVGMEESFIDHLFDKFSQEDDSVTRNYGGTGLGMSICKELIELMGGEISVESGKNRGTTISFILKLPKGNMKDLPEKENVEVDPKLLNGKHILITDDNEMNRLMASMILENFGAHITNACDGKEAFDLLTANEFDLVLMDVQMPVMDGLEATKLIRKTIQKQIPIIALTAFALKGDNQKCFDAGMNDYLSKPFHEIQLLEIVSKWLGKSSKLSLETTKTKEHQAPLYSLTQIEDIARGSKEFIDKIIDLFIKQMPISLKEMRDAYDSKDFVKLSKEAHRIKPSIDHMGIVSLKEEIREIEYFAVEYGESERLDRLLNKVNEVLNQVISELKKADSAETSNTSN